MKRVLCGLLLGGAALAATPAFATEPVRVEPVVWTDPNGRVGVGFLYSTNGGRPQPGGAAYVAPSSADACVGFSYQIPFCVSDYVGGPID
jgi:hypothetical protein